MKKTLFDDRKLVIFADGGSRGNPGPSALGTVIGDKEYGEYLGVMTNNQAEYRAVIFALKKAKHLLGGEKAKQTDVEVRLDSELLVNQLSGVYKIREPELKLLFVDVWNARMDFKNVLFFHVPRAENKRADMLVNQALDKA